MGLVRMRTGIRQPIPVRRLPTQVPALLPGLGSHRRQHPMPRSQHLALRLRTEHHDQRLRRRILAHPPPAGLGQPHLRAARSNSAITFANSSPENARSYSPTTTASNRRSGEDSSAGNAAARGRDAHGNRREQPSSKNSTRTAP